MAGTNGPEVPFPMKQPGVPFPIKEILEKIGNSLFTPGIPRLPDVVDPLRSGNGDGGSYPTAPAGYTETLGEGEYRAYRLGTALFIEASGTLPNRNQIADLRMSYIRIFPPQFDLVFYTPAFTLPALRSFSFTEQFGFPPDADFCTVNDARGRHVVPIEDAATSSTGAAASFFPGSADGEEDKRGAGRGIGFGASLQEAFDHAVAQLPGEGGVADQLVTYTLAEAGLVKGGIAGINLHYCKVTVQGDGDSSSQT